MTSANTMTGRLIATLMSVMALTACGGGDEAAADDEATGEIDYSFNCNEARGALHTYQMMVDGQSRIDEGTLESSPLSRLAEERKAAAEVIAQIDGWSHARQARRDALRAIPPVFSNGRVVEPDTTAIDRQMMQSIQPHHAALKKWVDEECGGV